MPLAGCPSLAKTAMTKDKRRGVQFCPKIQLKQTLILSPDSCFKRTKKELAEMYWLQKVRRADRRRAEKLMNKHLPNRTFLISDYIHYIKEDEDDENDAIIAKQNVNVGKTTQK